MTKKLKTLCQLGDDGLCTQCRESFDPKWAKTCPAKSRERGGRPHVDSAALVGRHLYHQAVRWLWHQLGWDRRGPCTYLGSATGDLLKVSCRSSDRKIPSYRCLHHERQINTRRGENRPGLCTPTGTCNDSVLGIQPCQHCRLWKSRQLLSQFSIEA